MEAFIKRSLNREICFRLPKYTAAHFGRCKLLLSTSRDVEVQSSCFLSTALIQSVESDKKMCVRHNRKFEE